jgi:arginyl-tRNA synthetase
VEGWPNRLRPRQDSNLRTRLRRPALYPLSYEGGIAPECINAVVSGSPPSEVVGGVRRGVRDRGRCLVRHCGNLDPWHVAHDVWLIARCALRIAGERSEALRSPPMPTFPGAVREAVSQALAAAASDGSLPTLDGLEFAVERPRDRVHGDWAVNAPMVAAKPAGKSPRDVAGIIVEHLPQIPHAVSVEVAGPGFINVTLGPSWYLEVLHTAAVGGPDHARSDVGAGERIQVEFVSSNPNGPLHIGHGRGGVIGDVLSRMLAYVGHPVTREYYYNDAGVQMDHFAASLEARYLQTLGRGADVPEDGYHGEYVAVWARELVGEVGDAYLALPEEERRQTIRRWGLARAMRDIEETLEVARIRFDVWVSETSLHESGEVARSIEVLRERGQVYEAEGATWFRTTDYGDEKDRVLVKSDGTYTYIAPDVAYHRDKFERGFDRVIDVWGADHHGYVPRMKAAVEALGYDPDRLEVVINQMVNLTRGGEPMRMSTRAGEFVTFREVLDEVGTDATRYHLAAYSPDTAITFDLEAARAQSMDNPVYYLQYAHARMCALARFAAEQGVSRLPLDEVDLTVLADPSELDLLRQADRLGEEVLEAARRRAPHRLTAYGYEFATAFHRFYTECRIVTDDAVVTQARLWLVEASRSVMLAILDLLGLTAPESM